MSPVSKPRIIPNIGKYEILTPNGFEYFKGIQIVEKNYALKFTFTDESLIEVSTNHRFQHKNGADIIASYFVCGDFIKTKDGLKQIKNIDFISKSQELYDAINVGKNHRYITNDLVSHNCSFIGSSDTLLSKKKLSMLLASVRKPKYTQNGLDVYEDPAIDIENNGKGRIAHIPHKYIMVVDTAQGKQLDYSAFVVIDITTIPYNIVAKYKSNVISTLVYPQVVYNVAKKYNDAWVLVELNDSPEVAKDLHHEYEYENIFKTQTRGRNGQILSNGFIGRGGVNATVPGVKMSKQVKRIGCAQMKSLIEMDKLMFQDMDIISQLTNFVSNGPSFSAAEGQHDDLVTPMVLFSWLVNQKNFKEMMDSDVKKSIKVEYEKELMHNMTPMGYIGGLIPDEDTKPEYESGDWWYPVENIYT